MSPSHQALTVHILMMTNSQLLTVRTWLSTTFESGTSVDTSNLDSVEVDGPLLSVTLDSSDLDDYWQSILDSPRWPSTVDESEYSEVDSLNLDRADIDGSLLLVNCWQSTSWWWLLTVNYWQCTADHQKLTVQTLIVYYHWSTADSPDLDDDCWQSIFDSPLLTINCWRN